MGETPSDPLPSVEDFERLCRDGETFAPVLTAYAAALAGEKEE